MEQYLDYIVRGTGEFEDELEEMYDGGARSKAKTAVKKYKRPPSMLQQARINYIKKKAKANGLTYMEANKQFAANWMNSRERHNIVNLQKSGSKTAKKVMKKPVKKVVKKVVKKASNKLTKLQIEKIRAKFRASKNMVGKKPRGKVQCRRLNEMQKKKKLSPAEVDKYYCAKNKKCYRSVAGKKKFCK